MKKVLKIASRVLGLILALGIAYLTNAYLGNPVSRALAKKGAERYLAETYPGTDYVLKDEGYNLKTGRYYAHVISPASVDTAFSLSVDSWGKVLTDSYSDVDQRYTTARRLDAEYRSLTDAVFEGWDSPYRSDIAFGMLEIYTSTELENTEYTDLPSYALRQESLELDGQYDISELGACSGHLVVYAEAEELSAELTSEIMLALRKRFDEARVPFHALDFILQFPKAEDGCRPRGFVGVSQFPYEEIREEGMVERVAEADAALHAFYGEPRV